MKPKVRFEKSCRTCAFWGKPSSKQARADYAFACHAPTPMPDWPESVIDSGTVIKKRPMTRDEGKRCLAWEIIF